MAPCSGCLKINCDGAFAPSLSFGAAAFIVRDSKGVLVDGGSESFQCSSPQFAEAKAVFLGIEWARSNGVDQCIIKSDGRRLVEAIEDPCFMPSWDGSSIIDSIRSSAASLGCVSFRFVGRFGNRAVHWLAFHQKVAALPLSWKFKCPPPLAAILADDFSPLGIG